MASPSPLSKANTTFCLNLFKQLSDKDKSANIFYSPFSISSALAMVLLGARGNTATQMSKLETKPAEDQQEQQQQQLLPPPEPLPLLQPEPTLIVCCGEMLETKPADDQQEQQQQLQPEPLPLLQPEPLPTLTVCYGEILEPKPAEELQLSLDYVHATFSQLLKELIKADAPYSLSVANRLYGDQSFGFAQEYLDLTKKYYEAKLEPVDFRTKYEEVRLRINAWVEKQTNDKIKDLLDKKTVTALTRLVLVNAIYFKGKWQEPFQEKNTKDEKFRINKNEKKTVKMMHMNESFRFRELVPEGHKVLELPYKGRDLSMILLLPRDIDDNSTGLEELEKNLTWETFTAWTQPGMMTLTDVDVALPRFKMEENYGMKDHLVAMGMVDAFDLGMSNFSGMYSSSENLAVSAVIHKAFVEVNEEGTEAAAATAVTMMVGCCLKPRGTFIADHPFLFFIRHNPTMSILFAGRYCSPE